MSVRMSKVRRTGLVCVIGLGLWSAVAVGAQRAPAGGLTEALRTHLKGEAFAPVTSVRGLPLGVRQDLQALWGTPDLDIAEPGAEFQGSGATGGAALPSRRLVLAGCSGDHHCLIYYERGGPARLWIAALFQWTPAATRLEWAGTAPGGLKTIDDVRGAFLTGAIKGPTSLW